jgi:hypothetical protein
MYPNIVKAISVISSLAGSHSIELLYIYIYIEREREREREREGGLVIQHLPVASFVKHGNIYAY